MSLSFIKEYKSLLFYPIIVCIISWVHFVSTGSFMVDFNPTQPLYLRYGLFLVLSVAFLLFYLKLYRVFIQDILVDQSYIRLYSYIVLCLSFFTAPVFSNDIFSMLGYSDAFLHGANVYLDFDAKFQTNYVDFINPLYQNLNCKYGPINVLLMSIPVRFAGDSVFFALLYTKVLYLGFALLYVELAIRIGRFHSNRLSLVLLLTPIWFIQGLGQFHNDIIGVVFILVGYYLLLKEKLVLGSSMLVLAILCKFTFIIFLALPFLCDIEQKGRFRTTKLLKIGLVIGFLSVGLGYVLYSPLIDNFSQILAPVTAMNTERPSSTFADIAAYGMLLFNSDFESNYSHTISIFKIVGLIIILGSSLSYLRNYKYKNAHKVFLLIVFTSLIFVYSHRFLPWYLMVIPVFLTPDRKDWMKWFLIVSFVSMFQDFAIFIDTSNVFGQIVMAVATIITVLAFLYKIKKRFSYSVE